MISRGSRHLISSEEWSIEEIDEALTLARQLRGGQTPPWIDTCLERRTVALFFNKESTRSRISFHASVVEMGGVPMTIDDKDIHPGENWTEFSHMLVDCCAAICARLWSTEKVGISDGEPMLREMAKISDEKDGPPLISMGHGRCHPCQGMYEFMTFQDELGANDLAGKPILYMWARGNKNAPWSPTQDSLMMATRRSMNVTLCHPEGFELDPKVMDVCRRNAENTKARGGEFTVMHDLAVARKEPEIVYARHWGEAATEGDWAKWYCSDDVLGGAKFIHPMPIERDVEVCGTIVDDEKRSMIRRLEKNKYFLQKAVLALLVRSHVGKRRREDTAAATEESPGNL